MKRRDIQHLQLVTEDGTIERYSVMIRRQDDGVASVTWRVWSCDVCDYQTPIERIPPPHHCQPRGRDDDSMDGYDPECHREIVEQIKTHRRRELEGWRHGR